MTALLLLALSLSSGNSFANDPSLAELKAFAARLDDTRADSLPRQDPVKLGHTYSVIEDGQGLYTTIYVGKRRPDVDIRSFVYGMTKHIRDIAALFSDRGLIYYRASVTGEFEFALQSWTTRAAAEAAFADARAQPTLREAGQFLENLAFEER